MSIKIAIVGLGNCASSLIQGLFYYKDEKDGFVPGLMHTNFGGYLIGDIEVVVAFDVNSNKVGKDLSVALYAEPNNTTIFKKIPKTRVKVSPGKLLDGVNKFTKPLIPLIEEEGTKESVVNILKESEAEIIVNYLPVGSEKATNFYVEAALEAKCGFVNCIPCFVASDPEKAKKFTEAKLPIVGDDIKAQIGATITHRTLVNLFMQRGMKVLRTYQLNFAGNTDFLNMKEMERLNSKKISKTEAVTSIVEAYGQTIEEDNIHISPSAHVPWQKDNKIAVIRIESEHFGDVPMHIDVRLSVEDSPNSAGVVIDAIRCCKIALDRGLGGPIEGPSAFFMKRPPKQYLDSEAKQMVEDFINNE